MDKRLVRLVGLLVVVVALAACAKTVKQDAATGADGKIKGAKEIRLEDTEGKASGIVTYPGGDRIDWTSLKLPDGKAGSLEIKLSWQPPRPGLQLAFDVFDPYNAIVASVQVPRRASTARSRTLTVENAAGQYFIRVYAVGRGDAGKYKLAATFTEVGGYDPGAIEIPDPPKLPAVPEAAQGCDEFAFDPKVPACKAVCPAQGAPPGWPACAGVCPAVPDINNAACWKTMPCPNPPDRRVGSCPLSAWPECDLTHKDPQNPRCDGAKAKPVLGKLKNVQATSDGVIVTINRGSSTGVEKGWHGRFLKAGTTKSLDGGDFEVMRVSKDDCLGKLRLTSDTVQANPDVELSPP